MGRGRGKDFVGKGITDPPPPRKDSLAALTMAETWRVVISVRSREIFELSDWEGEGGAGVDVDGGGWSRESL